MIKRDKFWCAWKQKDCKNFIPTTNQARKSQNIFRHTRKVQLGIKKAMQPSQLPHLTKRLNKFNTKSKQPDINLIDSVQSYSGTEDLCTKLDIDTTTDPVDLSRGIIGQTLGQSLERVINDLNPNGNQDDLNDDLPQEQKERLKEESLAKKDPVYTWRALRKISEINLTQLFPVPYEVNLERIAGQIVKKNKPEMWEEWEKQKKETQKKTEKEPEAAPKQAILKNEKQPSQKLPPHINVSGKKVVLKEDYSSSKRVEYENKKYSERKDQQISSSGHRSKSNGNGSNGTQIIQSSKNQNNKSNKTGNSSSRVSYQDDRKKRYSDGHNDYAKKNRH